MSKIERIRPGVKAFIVHQGKILVIKERIHHPGTAERILHDVPGGGIDLGETLHETVKREVFEEVGLQIEIDYPVGSWDFQLFDQHDGVHIVCLGFRCHVQTDSLDFPTIDTSKNPAKEDIFETFWESKEKLLQNTEIFPNENMRKSLENVRI